MQGRQSISHLCERARTGDRAKTVVLPSTALGSRSSTCGRNAKYDIAAVVAQQQQSVLELSRRHRSPPDVTVVGDEARQEVFVVACRLIVLHVHPHQLVSGAQAAVP